MSRTIRPWASKEAARWIKHSHSFTRVRDVGARGARDAAGGAPGGLRERSRGSGRYEGHVRRPPPRRPSPPARPRARASPPPPLRRRRTLSSRASAEARSGAGDAGADASASADGAHAAAPVALADLAPSAAAAVAATSSAATAPSASDASSPRKNAFVPTPELLRHCEPPSSNGGRVLKIAVLLSGGVDSSVALTLLKAAGHDVTAFYLQIWFQEDFRNYWDQCPWEDDLRVARGVCDALDVPLEVVPLTDAYWDLVVSHSIDEIARGRTPNPDVLCNSRVKFGAFREHLATAYPDAFDRVASGHYAAMDRTSDDGNVRLVLSGDARKDQTYFLAHLSQTQLRHLSFPVGGLPKESLRAVARAAGLPNADRKDSQGICFLGKVKFSEFVAEHLGEREGAIVELETGDLLGTHRGFWFHTIGQRSGLGLSGGPWYVAAKDVDGNVVYATREYYALEKRRNAFEVEAFSWVSGTPPPRCRDGYAFGIKAASAKSAKSGGTHAVPSRTVPSSGSPRAVSADDVAKEAATRDPTVPGSPRHRDRGVLAAVRQDAARREPLRVRCVSRRTARRGRWSSSATIRARHKCSGSRRRDVSRVRSSRRRRRTRRSSRGTRGTGPSSRGVRRIAEDKGAGRCRRAPL